MSAAEINVAAKIDTLATTALAIKRQRDELAAAMRDLIEGADLCIPYFSGAAQRYMQEVKRVASAALREAGLQ